MENAGTQKKKNKWKKKKHWETDKEKIELNEQGKTSKEKSIK